MSVLVLPTKLFIPRLSSNFVSRLRLLDLLEGGWSRKVTLVCAPAGFGKSSLISEWVLAKKHPCAWVSLDVREQDSHQFVSYLVAAIQTVDAKVGVAAWALLQTSPPPSVEAVLTVLLKKIAALDSRFLLVLDDYHTVASKDVDKALTFLIDHLPQQVHLVVATRDEPSLSLARLRAQGQLTEVRLHDLQFKEDEVTSFLNGGMKLKLSSTHISALAQRTEGWIAGLQLVGISLQGHKDPEQFIRTFSGSHRFVQDFLLEEVLHAQTPRVQYFLLRTSILDRLCGPLCDAVMQGNDGLAMLSYLEQANLFIIPLDLERRWFRYHHLFADMLRRLLAVRESASPIHICASEWYETHGLPVEAFQQAIAAGDIDRTIRLVEGDGMPLYFRGVIEPVIHWLQSQPQAVFNTHPRLWVMLAWSWMISGYPKKVEVVLQRMQATLDQAAKNSVPKDIRGQIATLKAWVAVANNDVPLIHLQAKLALNLLDSGNLAVRLSAHCVEGVGHQFAGNRLLAKEAYARVVSSGESSGNFIFTMVASMGLARIQATENQLHLAARTYRDVLQKMQDPTHLMVCEAHLGLALILYEWNDLDAAKSHAQLGSSIAEPLENGAGLSADVLLARILMLHKQTVEANALLTKVAIAAHTRNFVSRLQEAVSLQALGLMQRGQFSAALESARQHQLPLCTARALLAQGKAADALLLLETHCSLMEERGCVDESLKARVLQALAFDALGERDRALDVLRDALFIAQPGGFVRTFVDEGSTMALLLSKLAKRGVMPDYIDQLLAAWDSPDSGAGGISPPRRAAKASLADPLTQRELEILQLIRQGDSNQRIGEKLFLSLSTVKWHNQRIFEKLQVKRRTEAVASALALDLLSTRR